MKIGQQIMRFGIKKLSIGVVSVAVGFAFIVPTGVSANEGNHGLKNEGSVSVVAKDSPVKENTDKKQEVSITEGKATATQSTLETKEVVTHGKEKAGEELYKKESAVPHEELKKEEILKDEPKNSRPVTEADFVKISKGELHVEKDLVDNSLYGGKFLDPDGDDDHDGIKIRMNCIFTIKMGKTI